MKLVFFFVAGFVAGARLWYAPEQPSQPNWWLPLMFLAGWIGAYTKPK